MVIVTSGKNKDGSPCEFYLDENVKKNLDVIKERVTKRGWDSVILIAGLPGAGKSHFVQFLARYLDSTFEAEDYCFDADQWIEATSNKPKHSSIPIDECFDMLNNKITMSKDYQKMVSHIQLLRQQGHFLFLLLPNFFDLGKAMALYRSSILFVIYTDENGRRGRFACYDRSSKKQLYIKGSKAMDYGCVQPNFRGRFQKAPIIDWDLYEANKKAHLLRNAREKMAKHKVKSANQRDKLITYMKMIQGLSVERISEVADIPIRTIYDCIHRQGEYIKIKFGENDT